MTESIAVREMKKKCRKPWANFNFLIYFHCVQLKFVGCIVTGNSPDNRDFLDRFMCSQGPNIFLGKLEIAFV